MLYLICITVSRVGHALYEVPYAQEFGTFIWGPCYNSTLCAIGLNVICATGKNSKSRHLTLYQRKMTSEELPYWPLKQPNKH